MALLDDTPRSASVRALEETELVAIKREALEKLLAAKPVAAAKFYKAMSMALAVRLRHANEAVFKARDHLGQIVPPS